MVRKIACARSDELNLLQGFRSDGHLGADAIAVAAVSNDLDANCVAGAPRLVSQENCRTIVAVDQDVQIPVVIEVPKGRAARRLALGEEISALQRDI